MRHKCTLITGFFALILLVLGILLLSVFPLVAFPKLVKSQLQLKQEEDGSLPKSTFYWANPPAQVYLQFTMFDVINDEDVLFHGRKPIVVERGPYAFRQIDRKQELHFNKGEVDYKVKKQFIYSKEKSCETCKETDTVKLPNLSLMTTRRLLFLNDNLKPLQNFLADFTPLFFGLYPYRKVRVLDTLFLGYSDPMLDFLNSKLKADLEKYFNKGKPLLGFDIPQIDILGYFPLYNNTDDGVYYANTGADKIEDMGLLKSWDGAEKLNWWKSDYANELKGTSDGAVSGTFLKDTKNITMFQSFLCRHFHLEGKGSKTIEGIDGKEFVADSESYNTLHEKYTGYQYENDENLNFFPDACPELTTPSSCNGLNCKSPEGYCNSCCQNSTNSWPGGIHQHTCFPGRRRRVPFLAFDSLPHFYNAPKGIQQSVTGLNPKKEFHDIGGFVIQPTVGSTLKAMFRNQFNIAVPRSRKITTLKHAFSAIIPCFWLQLDVKLEPYAYDFIRMSVMTIPKIAFFVGIGLVVVGGVVPILLGLSLYYRHRK